MSYHTCICGYEWDSRVKEPKACPRCKRRTDSPYKPAERINKKISLSKVCPQCASARVCVWQDGTIECAKCGARTNAENVTEKNI